MPTYRLKRKQGIGIKTETTQGTAATIAATDFTTAYDVKITPKVEMNPQNYVSTSFDRFRSLPGKKMYDIEFTIPLHGSGTAGTAVAPLGAALQASGLLETVNAATSVVYSRTSSAASTSFYGPGKSATCKFYQDGMLHVAAGCMFDASLEIEAGKPVAVKFKGSGVYAAVTDASFPTITILATASTPPVVKSASHAIDNYSMIASKMTIKLNNKLSQIDDVNSANSILGFVCQPGDIDGDVDPLEPLVATYDFWGKMMSGSEASGTIAIGATAGNICTITAPKFQFGQIDPADRDGLASLSVPFMLNRSSGDDSLVLTFT